MITCSKVDLHRGDSWGLLFFFWVTLGSLADPGPVGSQGGKVKMMYRYGLGRRWWRRARLQVGQDTGTVRVPQGGRREKFKVSRTRRKESCIKYRGDLVQLVGRLGSWTLWFSDEKGVSINRFMHQSRQSRHSPIYIWHSLHTHTHDTAHQSYSIHGQRH